jgi:hypothetical protein
LDAGLSVIHKCRIKFLSCFFVFILFSGGFFNFISMSYIGISGGFGGLRWWFWGFNSQFLVVLKKNTPLLCLVVYKTMSPLNGWIP